MIRLALLLTLLVLPGIAKAQCLRDSYEIAAWHSQGTAALVRIFQINAAGNMANAYAIVRFDGKPAETFVFSSDFRQGRVSGPVVAPEPCDDTAERANQSLENLGFKSRFNVTCGPNREAEFVPGDDEGRKLSKKKSVEAANQAGLAKSRVAISRPLAATLDGRHFIVVGNNGSCLAQCGLVIYDADTKLYTKLGNCW
ncbi:MAG: hypothetical protein AB7H77_04720 [Bdellovibrionales bacterium]